jgi:hypothetical protein
VFNQYRKGHSTIDQLAKQFVVMMRVECDSSLKQALKGNGPTEEDMNKILE